MLLSDYSERGKIVALSLKRKKNELRGGADGHVLAISDYEPGSEYVYYWGAAWDKADIKTPKHGMNTWQTMLQKVRNPLTVTIK